MRAWRVGNPGGVRLSALERGRILVPLFYDIAMSAPTLSPARRGAAASRAGPELPDVRDHLLSVRRTQNVHNPVLGGNLCLVLGLKF